MEGREPSQKHKCIRRREMIHYGSSHLLRQMHLSFERLWSKPLIWIRHEWFFHSSDHFLPNNSRQALTNAAACHSSLGCGHPVGQLPGIGRKNHRAEEERFSILSLVVGFHLWWYNNLWEMAESINYRDKTSSVSCQCQLRWFEAVVVVVVDYIWVFDEPAVVVGTDAFKTVCFCHFDPVL